MSASLFVPNTCCAFTVGSGLLSLWCLPSWVQQDSLPSPLPPSPCLLVGHSSFSNLQAAPLGQPLTASTSLFGSTSALLHREHKTLVLNRGLRNLTEINTSHFWGFLLFLKTASKAALWALCVLGLLHCCHWVWEDSEAHNTSRGPVEITGVRAATRPATA